MDQRREEWKKFQEGNIDFLLCLNFWVFHQVMLLKGDYRYTKNRFSFLSLPYRFVLFYVKVFLEFLLRFFSASSLLFLSRFVSLKECSLCFIVTDLSVCSFKACTLR